MTTRLAMEEAGGLSSAPPSALLQQVDPRDVNVGIKNPYYEKGHSDQEYYNRKALPWEGAAYSIAGGSVVQVAGRSEAASGTKIEQNHPNLAEVWQRFARAQQNRDPNPGNIDALMADLRSVASNLDKVGTIDPSAGEGQSLRALKARAKQR